MKTVEDYNQLFLLEQSDQGIHCLPFCHYIIQHLVDSRCPNINVNICSFTFIASYRNDHPIIGNLDNTDERKMSQPHH